MTQQKDKQIRICGHGAAWKRKGIMSEKFLNMPNPAFPDDKGWINNLMYLNLNKKDNRYMFPWINGKSEVRYMDQYYSTAGHGYPNRDYATGYNAFHYTANGKGNHQSSLGGWWEEPAAFKCSDYVHNDQDSDDTRNIGKIWNGVDNNTNKCFNYHKGFTEDKKVGFWVGTNKITGSKDAAPYISRRDLSNTKGHFQRIPATGIQYSYKSDFGSAQDCAGAHCVFLAYYDPTDQEIKLAETCAWDARSMKERKTFCPGANFAVNFFEWEVIDSLGVPPPGESNNLNYKRCTKYTLPVRAQGPNTYNNNCLGYHGFEYRSSHSASVTASVSWTISDRARDYVIEKDCVLVGMLIYYAVGKAPKTGTSHYTVSIHDCRPLYPHSYEYPLCAQKLTSNSSGNSKGESRVPYMNQDDKRYKLMKKFAEFILPEMTLEERIDHSYIKEIDGKKFMPLSDPD